MTIVTTVYRPKRTPSKRKPRTLALPVIVTAKRRSVRLAETPELTPEEHQRRGDAAEALFQEITRTADNQA